MDGTCGTHGEYNKIVQNLYWKTLRRNSPLGRSSHRWEDNMNANLRESEKLWTGFIWLRIHTSGYAKVNDPRYI
jgi:hypothetical protein